MRSFGATGNAAVAASAYRAGWALRVAVANGPTWLWTSVPSGVTINAETYLPRPLTIEGFPSYGDEALSSCNVAVAGSLTADLIREWFRADPAHLRRSPAKVYELLSTGPSTAFDAVLWFDGAVEMVNPRAEYAWFQLGPLYTAWGVVVPDPISAMCTYRSASQCAYATTCAKTYDACTSNANTAHFGGFRFMFPSGTRIEFRDSGVTIGGGEGSTRPSRRGR